MAMFKHGTMILAMGGHFTNHGLQDLCLLWSCGPAALQSKMSLLDGIRCTKLRYTTGREHVEDKDTGSQVWGPEF